MNKAPKIYFTLTAACLARQVEWESGVQVPLTFYSTELAGEVGELCNVIKKMERERLGLKGSRATPEQMRGEFGDAAICLWNLARRCGVDMELAITEAFNAKSDEHGFTTYIDLLKPMYLGMDLDAPEKDQV